MVSIVDIIQRLFMVSVVGFLMVSVVAGNYLNGFRRWFLWFPSWQENVCFMVSVAGFSMDSAVAGGFIILELIERFLVCFVFLGLVSVAALFMASVVAGKHCFMVSVVGLLMVSVVARNVF